METSQLPLYLRLFHAHWLSPAQFSKLVLHFGSAKAAIDASAERLLEAGLGKQEIDSLKTEVRRPFSARAEADLHWASCDNQSIICFSDTEYPPLLKEIEVPPPLLFVRGNIQTLLNPQLAIVGSRRASSYGLRMAYWMANAVSSVGLSVCSGLARGIDARAHQGALAAGGDTIAIIGTGIDEIYPVSNRKLAEEIEVNGAIVSEFPRGTPPQPYNFPRRNRIMSGMSLGTLVVEAAVKSGSLITAKLALEQNREVFAIPGLVTNPEAQGCHRLIMDGARLVEKPEDILTELGWQEANADLGEHLTRVNIEETTSQIGSLGRTAKKLVETMGYQGCELQTLLGVSKLEHQALLELLLTLELNGAIQVFGGRYFKV